MTDTNSDMMMYCASCGIKAGDNIKLRTCTACKSARYCSINCQRDAWPKHKFACKTRAAKLQDEILFRCPESTHLGDCPMCLLPLEVEHTKSIMMTCCSKIICDGCDYANELRDVECPLCCQPVPTDEELDLNVMKRAEAGDPVAIRQMGSKYSERGDYEAALKNFTRAAKLGDVEAHSHLVALYQGGEGVEKDEKKEIYHLEQAAIGGNALARHNLGCEEGSKGRIERAMKHFIIAASHGLDESIEMLKGWYADGYINKEIYDKARNLYQAAVDVRKSPQREAAKLAKQNLSDEQKQRDEILLKQPSSCHLGDCSICLLPLPLDDVTKYEMIACCGKPVCGGCLYASVMRDGEVRDGEVALDPKCPSCEQLFPQSQADRDLYRMRRAEANDAAAILEIGTGCFMKEDYSSAFDYWTKAAKLGDIEAHYNLSSLYYEGKGVEKDESKFVYHCEEAAIGGHPLARRNIGAHENKNQNDERAYKHFVIAASLGDDESLKLLEEGCESGRVKKDDFAAVVRAHKDAVDATKSPQREFASVALQQLERDKLLFKRPECSHLGDCPICLLPMDLDNEKAGMLACCSKLLCDGCMMAKKISEEERSVNDGKCPFCRKPCPKNEEEMTKNIKKRIDANDPFAIREKGLRCYEKGDHVTALELWTKAANLGDIDAHFRLGKAYSLGEGVEKDVNKQTYYYEVAAIGGHPSARFNLGVHDLNSGNIDRGVKHIMISASHGHDLSIQTIKQIYPLGYVTKEEFAVALRAHKAAVDATKSIQREASAEAQRNKTWPYVFHPDKGSHISHPRNF